MRDDDHDSIRGERPTPARRAFSAVLTTTLLALVLAMLAAGVVWDGLAERHRRDLTEYFEFEAAEIALRIEERFRGHRQVLRGARALYAASESVDRAEWREYVRGLQLEVDHPGIQGVGFAQRVRPQVLAEHVAAVRAEGFADYRVWPAGARDEYSAIVLLEPFDWRNQRAFGFDMYAEPVRREAMERALRTGRGALSGRVLLVQETAQDRQAGVLLYMPVFANRTPLATEAERRSALVGWAYSAFRMNDLLSGMLGRHSDSLRLRIFDQDEAPKALLYDSHPGVARGADATLRQVRRLPLDGREWVLVMEALPGFAARFEDERLELVAIGLIGLLFVVVTWSFSTARERARALARTSESLRRSEVRYAALVNLAHEGIAATDETFCVDFVNPHMAQMLGVSPERLAGCPLDTFWAAPGRESREQILARLRAGRGSRYEVELIRSNGYRFAALVSDAPLADEAGRFKGAILMITDISERKLAERRIAHLAGHDPLTGIANRLRFGELFGETLARARRYGHRFALLFVDLDRFKAVNDGYGHLVGDRLLVEATGRMHACLRASDTLGRRGGDEFVVLLPEIDVARDAEAVAEKIRAALAQPFVLDGRALCISTSIGIVLYPEHGDDEDTLMRRADEAMYRAKSEGRNRTASYIG